MVRYFTKTISEKELEQKILDAWKKHTDYSGIDSFKGIARRKAFSCLTPTVEQDLAKVEFTPENEDVDQKGLVTLPNGLTVLFIRTGGDWELPFVYIIYYDGSCLRAYIPEDGNPWNTSVNSAYGNHQYKENVKTGEETDTENVKKRGFKCEISKDGNEDFLDEVELDYALILQDIQKRIIHH